MFKFSFESNVYFGKDSFKDFGEIINKYPIQKVGIIMDSGIHDLPDMVKYIEDVIHTAGIDIKWTYSPHNVKEPTYDMLEIVADVFKSQEIDALIGIGGGSIMDLTKGVSILKTNPGKGIDYRGMNKVNNPNLPCILIPTTAGTGSEVTKTASFIDSSSKTKLGINGKNVGCLFAVLDPIFSLSCPTSVTISSGLDVLVHALEAVTCKTANDVSHLYGSRAIELLYKSLPWIIKEPKEVLFRERALLASYYAGLAMWCAGGGPASGVSYPLGVHYGVPHGLAGGLLVPGVIEMNIEKGYLKEYAGLNKYLLDDNTLDIKLGAERFLYHIKDFYTTINAPIDFKEYNVGRGHIENLVELTMRQRKDNLELNPVEFNEKDVRTLLTSIIK